MADFYCSPTFVFYSNATVAVCVLLLTSRPRKHSCLMKCEQLVYLLSDELIHSDTMLTSC